MVAGQDTRPVLANMTSYRQTRKEGTRISNQVLATRLGLRFAGALSFEGWERAGEQISRIVSSSAWCLGDWIIVGQSRFTDRYKHVIEAVGLDYQTVRNYAWVARRFELSRRRDTLSFQHHAEVASLPPDEQDYWLDRAEDRGWSRNRLRQEIRNSRSVGTDNAPKASTLPRIIVTKERIARWRASAEQMQMSLENWIVANLDSAAEMAQLETSAPVRRIDSRVREISTPIRQLEAAPVREVSDR
jgi:hypothetical protein